MPDNLPHSAQRPPRPASGSAFFDPQAQPLIACEPLPPLPAHCLRLDFIRHAFSSPPSWQVEPVFAAEFVAAAPGDVRRAAVLMPLVQRADGLHVLFTRRAEHLPHHAGQISFPGGGIDPADPSPEAAALRETYEEIGVGRDFIQVIGSQPAMLTVSKYFMIPIVGELLPGFELRPSAAEVADVFEVPLAVLMNPQLHLLHSIPDHLRPGRCYFSMRWQSHFIWGATAALIRNFYRFLAAASAHQEVSK